MLESWLHVSMVYYLCKLMQYYDNYVQRKRRRPDLSGQRHGAPVTEAHTTQSHVMEPAVDNRQERLKLAGVYGVITLCATIMAFVLGFDLMIWLEWFMGGFMIIFGSFKLIGYEMFIQMFPKYDPIAARSKAYTMAYPFIELFLGFLFVSNLLPMFRNLATLVIFGIGAWGVLKYISRTSNETIKCACLGDIIKLPLSNVTLIEDVLMAGMSVIMIIGYFIF